MSASDIFVLMRIDAAILLAHQIRMKRKQGRPTTKESPRLFKLCKPADKALDGMAKRFGWTATATVERALMFASTHPEFNVANKLVATMDV